MPCRLHPACCLLWKPCACQPPPVALLLWPLRFAGFHAAAPLRHGRQKPCGSAACTSTRCASCDEYVLIWACQSHGYCLHFVLCLFGLPSISFPRLGALQCELGFGWFGASNAANNGHASESSRAQGVGDQILRCVATAIAVWGTLDWLAFNRRTMSFL